jgi:hypothetical protein
MVNFVDIITLNVYMKRRFGDQTPSLSGNSDQLYRFGLAEQGFFVVVS